MSSFGFYAEFIEVFVNDGLGLRVKIMNGESHMYCNEWKYDKFPPNVIAGALTVIAGNNCIISTELIRRGKGVSIVVYKNDVLFCKTGSAIVEDVNNVKS